MIKLVLLRHGESIWNKENRFTGWTDVKLTRKGEEEARHSAQLLGRGGYGFDIAFTSVLKRATETLDIVMHGMKTPSLPVEYSWRLNERHYGALQGLNKAETAEKFGDDQVNIWRRSYDVSPPALSDNDPRSAINDPLYSDVEKKLIPKAECLKDTVKRVLPYWKHTIVPQIKNGKRVLIVAHGNSLRALIKYLDGLDRNQIRRLNIPTGIPLVYELDEKRNLKPIRHYYLGDQRRVLEAQAQVAAQGKSKAPGKIKTAVKSKAMKK